MNERTSFTSDISSRLKDNPVNQRFAIRIIEKRGHLVDLARNGKEAIDLYARKRFDVVLMDVQMPEMNGLDATAIIRQREQATGFRTPIIAMTAYAMKGDRERCLAAGMDAYIEDTPKTLSEIRTAIDRVDYEMLGRAAHSLKGVLGYFSGSRSAEAALRLQTMGVNRDLSGAQEALADLEEALGRLKSSLSAFTGEYAL